MAVDISSFLTEGAQVPSGSAVKATQSQTILPPWYTNYAQQLLSNQQALAAQPYQTYQGPRVAAFTPAQQQAFNMTGTAATAYQPALTQATQATQQALAAPGALATAQPYLAHAGQTAPQVMSEYMNPYTEQVVNHIGELGARNLSEKLMPAITSKYISAGQLGFGPRGGSGTPSGMLTDTARALRDTNADILAQQSQALQSGFTNAQSAAQADLQRQGALATAAGNLATAQTGQQLTGAEQLGALGQTAQTLGLTGANAMAGVGATQQAQGQKNLDTAYSDFLAQRGYAQEQINNMLNTLKGTAVSGAIPEAKQEYGIEPIGTPVNQPSTAATIGGVLTGGAALLKELGLKL